VVYFFEAFAEAARFLKLKEAVLFFALVHVVVVVVIALIVFIKSTQNNNNFVVKRFRKVVKKGHVFEKPKKIHLPSFLSLRVKLFTTRK